MQLLTIGRIRLLPPNTFAKAVKMPSRFATALNPVPLSAYCSNGAEQGPSKPVEGGWPWVWMKGMGAAGKPVYDILLPNIGCPEKRMDSFAAAYEFPGK